MVAAAASQLINSHLTDPTPSLPLSLFLSLVSFPLWPAAALSLWNKSLCPYPCYTQIELQDRSLSLSRNSRQPWPALLLAFRRPPPAWFGSGGRAVGRSGGRAVLRSVVG